MKLPEGMITQFLLSMILVSLVSIAFIIYQNMPGRYQYSGEGVIDTRTGVIKFARPTLVSGIPFDKLPNYYRDSTYIESIQLLKDQQARAEVEKLLKETPKTGK